MLAVGLLEDLKNEPYLQREVLEPFSGVTWRDKCLAAPNHTQALVLHSRCQNTPLGWWHSWADINQCSWSWLLWPHHPFVPSQAAQSASLVPFSISSALAAGNTTAATYNCFTLKYQRCSVLKLVTGFWYCLELCVVSALLVHLQWWFCVTHSYFTGGWMQMKLDTVGFFSRYHIWFFWLLPNIWYLFAHCPHQSGAQH